MSRLTVLIDIALFVPRVIASKFNAWYDPNPQLASGWILLVFTTFAAPALKILLGPPPENMPTILLALNTASQSSFAVVGLISGTLLLFRGWQFQRFVSTIAGGRDKLCYNQNGNAVSLTRSVNGDLELHILSKGRRISCQQRMVSIARESYRKMTLSLNGTKFPAETIDIRADNSRFVESMRRLITNNGAEALGLASSEIQSREQTAPKFTSPQSPQTCQVGQSVIHIPESARSIYRYGTDYIRDRASTEFPDVPFESIKPFLLKKDVVQSMSIVLNMINQPKQPPAIEFRKTHYTKFLAAELGWHSKEGTILNWLVKSPDICPSAQRFLQTIQKQDFT